MNCYRFGWLALVTLVVGMAGCEKPLFPSNMPRTQYERYDQMRGHYVPADRVDGATGARTPALRERLSPHRE
ncbi:MAG: hypothetical protein WD294_12345 [Phycisphaeraceae bacterium]